MRRDLTDDDREVIAVCGLSHILSMPCYPKIKALLTTLAERWHSDHNKFHLPTGEITVTTEDVYQILRIPIIGELVTRDVEK